jgi:hypothetical protein
MKLTDKALLAQLSISVPSFNKLDKQISLETTIAKGAVDGSGRYHKSLLPTCDLLKDIKQKATLIRTKFYTNTLPWGVKGVQMLPSANYLDFMTDFRKQKAEFEILVDRFCPEYPQLVANAQSLLGKSYNPDDYAHPADIRAKFSMGMAITNVAADDFRCAGISDVEEALLRSEIQATTQRAAQEAMKEAWQRLYDRVKHLADKLSDPAATFKNTTLEHITELCSILPRLNFTDDPNLEAMRQEVEGKLVGYHPDALRNDPDLRRDKAEEANDIMAKMGAFMGAAS